MQPAPSSNRAAFGALILLTAIWSYSWIVMKQVLRFVGPFEFSALRYALGTLVLFAVGTQAFRRGWFATLSRELGLWLFWGALILSPIAMGALMAVLPDPAVGMRAMTSAPNASAAVIRAASSQCIATRAG